MIPSVDPPGRGAETARGDWKINLKQLRSFCKVVEVGNLTKAAEHLHIAQPALGQQIRQLEESLGVPLLVRHSRGVFPTAVGALLFRRAADILQLVAETRRDVAALGGQSREEVTLGLTPSIALLLGSELMLQVRERIPGVFLRLQEDPSFELAEGVESGKLDLALTYEAADRPGVSKIPILQEDLLLLTVPCVSDCAEETITFAEALTHDLALTSRRDMVRCLVDSVAGRMALQVPLLFEVQSMSALRDIALRGLAACILPYGTVIQDLKAGALSARRIVDPPITRTLYLVRAAGRPPLSNEAALDTLIHDMILLLKDALGPLARYHPDYRPAKS